MPKTLPPPNDRLRARRAPPSRRVAGAAWRLRLAQDAFPAALLATLLGLVVPPDAIAAPGVADRAGLGLLPPHRQVQPADEDRFVVRGFEVVGASHLPPEDLRALLAPAIGRETDLAGLHAAAERVTQAYLRRGLVPARAHVPPQEVQDGIVRLVVVEGRPGHAPGNDAASGSDKGQRRALAADSEGRAIEPGALQQLQQLGDRTGAVVGSTLRPGASFDTAELELVVQQGRRLEAELALDNHGQRHTGVWRLRADLRGTRLLAARDTASLTLLHAGPGLRHGRVAWQVAPAAAPDWLVGAAASSLHYRLRGEMAALQARGHAGSLSGYALRPLHRSERAALQLQAVWEHKSLHDELGGGAVTSRKRARLATLGLSGERADAGLGPGRGGVWQGAASVVAGRLALDPGSAALDAEGAGTRGRYHKLVLQGARVQALGSGWEATLRAQAQAADGNLDGSEKLALGGPGAVRALDTGSAAVDQGGLATLELRHRVAGGWALGVFADAAAGHQRRHALPGDANRRRASGHGVLLDGHHGAWQFALQAAWAAGLSPRDARLWAQLSWRLP
jgi:hemolysin activation/secretion protein